MIATVEAEQIPTEIPPGPIRDCSSPITWLHAKYFERPEVERTERGIVTQSPPVTDDGALQLLRSFENGSKFDALYSGGNLHHVSASEADLGLTRMVGFVTQDFPQIKRLLRGSERARDKFDREDYLDRTIAKALGGMREFWKGPVKAHKDTTAMLPSKANSQSKEPLPIHKNQNQPDPDPQEGEDGSEFDSSTIEIEGVEESNIDLFITAREMAEQEPEQVTWLVDWFLAQGAITSLLGKIKHGKTLFWVLMLAGMLVDGQFLGRPTKKTPAVVLTEQSPQTLTGYLKRAGLADRDDVYILPWFKMRKAGLDWEQAVSAAALHDLKVGAELLIVDTLSRFAGHRGRWREPGGRSP